MAIGHAQLYQEFYNYDMQQNSDAYKLDSAWDLIC